MLREIEQTIVSDQRADFEALSKELVDKKEEPDKVGEEILEDEDLEKMWQVHRSFGSLPK